jgi:hypothetical protein
VTVVVPDRDVAPVAARVPVAVARELAAARVPVAVARELAAARVPVAVVRVLGGGAAAPVARAAAPGAVVLAGREARRIAARAPSVVARHSQDGPTSAVGRDGDRMRPVGPHRMISAVNGAGLRRRRRRRGNRSVGSVRAAPRHPGPHRLTVQLPRGPIVPTCRRTTVRSSRSACARTSSGR